MAIIDERTAQQLRERFAERVEGPVELKLYTRPGGGRLILPTGIGCPTCSDARELAEALAAAAPEQIALEVIDVSQHPAEVEDVPLLTVAKPGEDARIRFLGLPAGFEFAPVVDAIERVSSDDPGLGPLSLAALEKVGEDIDVMVFATPT